MKKWIAVILLICLSLTLLACGSSQPTPAPMNDKAFLKNMQKGLESRWVISNNEPNTFNSNLEKKESFKKCVNAELDAIGDISAYTFENTELKKLAEMYYHALENQLDGIKYIGADDAKYNEVYVKNGYNNRARAICRLADDFGLTVSSEHADNFDTFVSLGHSLLELDEVIKAMEGVFTDELVIECLGGPNYELIISNNTNYDLSDARIEFDFYDDKNVLVNNATEYMNSWKSGSTNRCSLYVKENFSRAEARISLYSNSIYDYLVTETHPIKMVNNMIINVSLKTSLPKEFSYTLYKTVTTKCKVTSFDYEVTSWSDGKATVKLYLSGSKTYDEKGDSYSRSVKIGWKLYDEKGNVVDSGNIRSSDIHVGESFTNASDSAYKLAPGSYTLELLDVG